LSRHDLGVGTRDLDTGIQASLVVSLNNISAEYFAGANTAVVRALRTWEAVGWPSIWTVGEIKKSVLLLQTKPWIVNFVCFHKLGTLSTVVELVWGSVWVPALSENQDVGGATEWVREDGNRSEVNIRVFARSLTRRGAIKVPFWEILESEFARFWDLENSLIGESVVSNRSTSLSGGVNRYMLTFDLERVPPWASIQMYLSDSLVAERRSACVKNSLGHSTSLLVERHVFEEL
jgi:hypothetical protein